MTTFEKARTFIYRNARPLDLARWQYHFENGSRDAVLNALAYYQNEDGGFGHALEADSWNPNPSPIQTWTATEILREIEFTDSTHPIMAEIMRYLENTKDFNSQYWYANVKSNNDFPRAPWWGYSDDPNHRCNHYNPTACLAGFIIRFADRDSEIFRLGFCIVGEAIHSLLKGERENDMHTLACYIRLLQYCEEANTVVISDLSELKARLIEQVKNNITTDTAEWESGYICKPSQFLSTKDSIFYEENRELAEYECEFIVKTQLDDGSWNIPWSWGDYPEEWAISKNWWKGNGIILNMLYLRGLGKL